MTLFEPIIQCYHFLCNPTREIRNPKIENPHFHVITLWVFTLLLNMFLLSAISLIIDFENMPNSFENLETRFSKPILFFIIVIAAPFIEELIFRYPIKRKLTITMQVVIIDIFIMALILTFFGFGIFAILIPVFLAIVSLIIIVQSASVQNDWDEMLDRSFPLIFYLVAVCFAFIHTYNYDASGFEWYQSPLLVMPQFFLALVLGYLRLRIGLWAAIYLHALNNFLPALALLFIA